MDETTEIFTEVGCGNAAAVAEMLRWKPELSRARDPSSLSILAARLRIEERAIDRNHLRG